MKFKSISIFLFLIDLVHGREGPLSIDENQSRLETCGIDKSHLYVHPWLFEIKIGGATPLIGTFISSRHFLTSSALLLRWHRKKCLEPISEHIQYEHNSTSPLEFSLRDPNDRKYTPILKNLRRFYLPKYCTQEVLENFDTDNAPMILEFEEEQKSPSPCLGPADSMHSEIVWQFDQKYLSRFITPFTSPTPFFYSAEITNGRVLEKIIGEKVTVLGINTRRSLSNTMKSNFYRMDWLEGSFCELVGVCKEGAVRPDPQSSTESPTTSASVETSGTPENSDSYGATTLEPSTVTAGTFETSVDPITSENPGTSSEVATTVLPPAPVHRRTMPPEYEDHGDYDMIFDSLYEFPEFREIEETPYEKKGCRKGFELVLVVLFVIFGV